MDCKNSYPKLLRKRNDGIGGYFPNRMNDGYYNNDNYKKGYDQPLAYGQPTFKYTSSRQFTPNRYNGTLRDFPKQFSAKLPQINRQRRYSPLPLWCKGGFTKYNHNNINNGIYNKNHGSVKFRKPSRPLYKMKTEEWSNYMMLDDDVESSSKSLVKIEGIWQSFIERDNYMDEVKQFNASNINVLMQLREANVSSLLSNFDSQILSVIANPGCFTATWNMLKLLHGETDLNEYVKQRNYTTSEISSSLFVPESFASLHIFDEKSEMNESEQVQDNNG